MAHHYQQNGKHGGPLGTHLALAIGIHKDAPAKLTEWVEPDFFKSIEPSMTLIPQAMTAIAAGAVVSAGSIFEYQGVAWLTIGIVPDHGSLVATTLTPAPGATPTVTPPVPGHKGSPIEGMYLQAETGKVYRIGKARLFKPVNPKGTVP